VSDEGAADPGGARDESVRSHRVDRGPGRLIIAVYALFAVAASSRSLVQIATRFDEAPLAYALSAASAVLYVVITGCLLRATSRAVRLASALIVVELVGVVVVGTLSIVDPEAFPDQTVWSSFGAGYLLLPLVLPVVGLLWIRRSGALAVG
jgi:hypothetical protein